MARVALLANPRSGAGEGAEVEQLLAAAGAEVETFALDERDAAVGGSFRRIVVAGGDGSVACAAEVAGRAGVSLAVVPVGTANDFARALELPLDPEEAARLAVRGTRTRRLDLGRVDGDRPFVNAVSAGLSPVAAREAHGLKGALGPLAYAAGALRAGLGAAPISCAVRSDGSELFSNKAWQVTVGLTGAFGGGAEIEADPHDGLLDVVVIPAGSRLGLVMRAYGMRAGSVEEQRGVVTGRGSEVEIDTEGDGGLNVDGELVRTPRVRVTVEPGAFELITG